MGELEGIEPKIHDLDDLEDRLMVLESVVAELKSEGITTTQLKMVKDIVVDESIYHIGR